MPLSRTVMCRRGKVGSGGACCCACCCSWAVVRAPPAGGACWLEAGGWPPPPPPPLLSPSSSTQASTTTSPAEVNLTAFDSRLASTCWLVVWGEVGGGAADGGAASLDAHSAAWADRSFRPMQHAVLCSPAGPLCTKHAPVECGCCHPAGAAPPPGQTPPWSRPHPGPCAQHRRPPFRWRLPACRAGPAGHAPAASSCGRSERSGRRRKGIQQHGIVVNLCWVAGGWVAQWKGSRGAGRRSSSLLCVAGNPTVASTQPGRYAGTAIPTLSPTHLGKVQYITQDSQEGVPAL